MILYEYDIWYGMILSNIAWLYNIAIYSILFCNITNVWYIYIYLMLLIHNDKYKMICYMVWLVDCTHGCRHFPMCTQLYSVILPQIRAKALLESCKAFVRTMASIYHNKSTWAREANLIFQPPLPQVEDEIFALWSFQNVRILVLTFAGRGSIPKDSHILFYLTREKRQSCFDHHNETKGSYQSGYIPEN